MMSVLCKSLEEPSVEFLFSAGIAYFPADGDKVEMLLEAADQRTYHAKRAGRGRVTGKLGE